MNVQHGLARGKLPSIGTVIAEILSEDMGPELDGTWSDSLLPLWGDSWLRRARLGRIVGYRFSFGNGGLETNSRRRATGKLFGP